MGESDAGLLGLGWEVWLNGMEVTQFTYFQQVGGIDCKPITGEITTAWSAWPCICRARNRSTTWSTPTASATANVFHQNEVEQSTYNFEHSDVEFLLGAFAAHEKQSKT